MDALQAQAARLREEVARHKAAIRRHRQQLGDAKAALDRLERECRQRGIAIIVHPSPGEGEISSWPPTPRTS